MSPSHAASAAARVAPARLQPDGPTGAEADVLHVEQCDSGPESQPRFDAESGIPLLGVVLQRNVNESPETRFDRSKCAVQRVPGRRQGTWSIAHRDARAQSLIFKWDARDRVSGMVTTGAEGILDPD